VTQASHSPYSSSFFEGNAVNSMRSARPVLQILRDLYSPTSIVDIGCGSGAWLATAETLGFDVLRGYDGPWADPAKYTSPNIDFVPVDMEQADFELDRRYDLAISVEVAEHLSADRADFIVGKLCAASDVVLFGAALPMQGGVHHIHEKPLTYWKDKFRDNGYEAFDIIRPAVWDNNDVLRWFRQNTVLYVKQGSPVLDPAKLHEMEDHIWDVVHPRTFQARTTNLRKQLHELRQERNELAKDLKAAASRIKQLERRMSTMRPPRKSLRTLSAKDVPAPIRPALTKAWHAMPDRIRTRIRPKH
jgi:SAM-dependent methyltransferase